MRKLAALALLALLWPHDAWALGYVSRPCGFDIDRDGNFGETTDDCNVCDGTASADSPPEASAASEWYVDATQSTSKNEPTCGTFANPCTTCTYVFTSRANLDDAIPDICCGKGVDSKEPVSGLSLPSGPSGTYDVSNSKFDFLGPATWVLPSKPTMVVATDTDDDGDYSDETFTIEGCIGGRREFGMRLPSNSDRIEFGYVRLKDFGSASCWGAAASSTQTGGLQYSSGLNDNIYGHDFVLDGINRGRFYGDRHAAFRPYKTDHGATHNVYFYNFNADRIGSYMVRGGIGNTAANENNNWVWAKWTGTWEGPPNCSGTAPKTALCKGRIVELFGRVTGLYFDDFIADSRSGVWNAAKTAANHGFSINNCNRDVFIRWFDLVDWKLGIGIEPSAGGGAQGECARRPPRPITNVNVGPGTIRSTAGGAHGDGSKCIKLGGGSTSLETEHTSGLTIANVFCHLPQAKSCFQLGDGSTPQGACDRSDTHAIVNNTIICAPDGSHGAINFAGEDGAAIRACTAPNIIIADNLVQGVGSREAIAIDPTYVNNSPGLLIRNNISNGAARYECGSSTNMTLAAWLDSSCDVSGDQQCTATFTSGDQLASGSCAINAGISTAAYGVTKDRRGEVRTGTYDVGSDEFGEQR